MMSICKDPWNIWIQKQYALFHLTLRAFKMTSNCPTVLSNYDEYIVWSDFRMKKKSARKLGALKN